MNKNKLVLMINRYLKFLLAPLAILYGLVVKVRNLLFDFKLLKSVSFQKHIICVGNITVGGTGKTPHVEYLLKILSTNHKIATLSRGYKRKTKEFRYVSTESNASEVGDEPLQMKLKYPSVKIAVDANRVKGISRLIKDNPDLDAIILDDAYQHRWVKPGLLILLIDYNRLITRDYFLPFGRLRDSVKEKRRAGIIIITKCPDNISELEMKGIQNELNPDVNQSVYFSTISYGEPTPVFNEFNKKLVFTKEKEIFAFAGIANPTFFYSFVKSKAKLMESHTFPDHFTFTRSKIYPIFDTYLKSSALNKAIVTTEKDAARLREIELLDDEFKKALFYIPIEVKFLKDQENNFNKQILTYARKD